MHCPYCGDLAKPATGKEIYPSSKRLWDKKFFLCRPCDAYVGCHGGKSKKAGRLKPLGTLANRNLRTLRVRAHRIFDRMWMTEGLDRSAAYTWLAMRLGIKKKECHIGHFNEEMCLKVIQTMKEYYGTNQKGGRDPLESNVELAGSDEGQSP